MNERKVYLPFLIFILVIINAYGFINQKSQHIIYPTKIRFSNSFISKDSYNDEKAPYYASQSTATKITRYAAPKEALPDIVIPNVFNFAQNNDLMEVEDERIWVPQTPCLSFRPLCLCVSQGYYVNLLKFKGGGILGRHRHSSPVHALTLKGSWGYKEHGWHASAGTYVFEPPGETHTLIVDEDCDEMITMFHVTGSLLYVDETGDTDNIVGFDDVFTKLEKAKKWYTECGLGEDYVQQFVR